MDNKTEWPQGTYRLTEKAYIGPGPGAVARIMEAGSTIVLKGKPGPHMEPLDEAARQAVAMAGEQTLDPTRSLATMTNGDVGDQILRALLARLEPAPGTIPTPVALVTPATSFDKAVAPVPEPPGAVPPPPPTVKR